MCTYYLLYIFNHKHPNTWLQSPVSRNTTRVPTSPLIWISYAPILHIFSTKLKFFHETIIQIVKFEFHELISFKVYNLSINFNYFLLLSFYLHVFFFGLNGLKILYSGVFRGADYESELKIQELKMVNSIWLTKMQRITWFEWNLILALAKVSDRNSFRASQNYSNSFRYLYPNQCGSFRTNPKNVLYLV